MMASHLMQAGLPECESSPSQIMAIPTSFCCCAKIIIAISPYNDSVFSHQRMIKQQVSSIFCRFFPPFSSHFFPVFPSFPTPQPPPIHPWRNLGSAIDHASGALAADGSAGSSGSVKAWYRRGLARRRLAEHRDEQQNLQLAQDVEIRGL